MNATNEDIAGTWIRYTSLPSEQQDENNPLFWAVETLYHIVENDPENAWKVIRIMTKAGSTDFLLACIAAGPLEDLLKRHGKRFIDRIEQEAASDPVFKKILGAVWQNAIPDDVWNRVKAVAGPSF
jgi:hypothetical protein